MVQETGLPALWFFLKLIPLGQSLVYELLYDGRAQEHQAHLMGLINPEKLQYDAQKLGQNEQKIGPSQPQVSPKSEGSQNAETPANKGLNGQKHLDHPESTYTVETLVASHPTLAAEGIGV